VNNREIYPLYLEAGKTHTVREFVDLAFRVVDIELEWIGNGIEEVGRSRNNGEILVKVDPRYYRPTEVDLLWGDTSKARNELGWEAKTTLNELVIKMVKYDLENDNYGGEEI